MLNDRKKLNMTEVKISLYSTFLHLNENLEKHLHKMHQPAFSIKQGDMTIPLPVLFSFLI